MAIWRYGLGMF